MSLHTSLYNSHLEQGAKMVDFAGWMMPIQYNNLREEVMAVRESVGVFDVSHMGEFFITGSEAIKFMDNLVTNDIANSEMSKAIYSPMCRDDGTIIDDLIVYKLTKSRLMVCVNASNIEKDLSWMKQQIKGFDCKLEDRSSEFSLLAIQGPHTMDLLKKLEIGFSIEDGPYYSVQTAEVNSSEVIVARTGYTGEDGLEIFADHDRIKIIWDELMANNVKPCGLGARDVLRLEVCFPLYGHELSDEVTPLDSGLKWTVKSTKEQFIGKELLSSYTPKYRLIKILLEKGIPRGGYKIENQDGIELGVVTSGTMSVSLGKGIAMARVKKELYSEDDQIFVNIRGKRYSANIYKKAFVAGGHK